MVRLFYYKSERRKKQGRGRMTWKLAWTSRRDRSNSFFHEPENGYLYYTCSVLTILEPIDILFSTCLITSVSIAESPRIDEVNFKEPKETRSEEDSENSRIDSARLRLLSLFDERSTRLFNDGIDCEKEARILTR